MKRIITLLTLLIVLAGCNLPVEPPTGQGWSQAAYLSPSLELPWDWLPDAAIAADGSAWVVWAQGSYENSQISARNYSPATGWKNTVPIVTGTSTPDTSVYAPRVLMDAAGNADFFYLKNNYQYSDIFTVTASATNIWSGHQLLTGINAGHTPSHVPAYAGVMSPGGNACVAWQWDYIHPDAGSTFYSIWANYNTGAGWSDNEMCNETFELDHPYVNGVHVLYDRNETPWVFWLELTNTPGLGETHYTHAAVTDQTIPTTGDQSIDSNALQSRYALDENGNPFLVWLTAKDLVDGTHYYIKYVRHDGAVFLPAATVVETADNTNMYDIRIVNNPATGAIGLMWAEHDLTAGAHALRYKLYAGNGAWGDTMTVVEEAGFPNYVYFDAGMDAAGNAFLCWERDVNGATSIWVAHYVAGQGVMAPQQIGQSDGGMNPRLAVNANGQAVAVWYEGTVPTGTRIKASVYQ